MDGLVSQDLINFSNFVESDTMKREDRIARDLTIFLRQNVGSVLYARSDGSSISLVENNENSVVYDLLLKVRIIEAVARYNQQTIPDLQAIVGDELILIERDGNKLDLFIGFFPLINPSLDTLVVLPFYFGGI